MKYTGTVSRGIKAPIIKQGDDIAQIVFNSVTKAIEDENINLNNQDVICITEAIVARAQGNYATLDQIATDIKNKFQGEVVGLIFPILSRNRFLHLLKAIAKGVKKLVIQLSYPSDEVGNHLLAIEELDEKGINSYSDVFTYQQFRNLFPTTLHPFTNIDYIELYKEVGNCEIILANDPTAILKYTDEVIVGSIHNRFRHKNILLKNGAKTVYRLDEILTQSIDGSGYHDLYGLLGSNVATDNTVKLFPRSCTPLVESIQQMFYNKYQKTIEVMVYGDGAFKDPIGGIWELADPVVSPGYTKGLEGTPNELKIKYLADNDLKDFQGEALEQELINLIKNKQNNQNPNLALGTTPRRITDLLGSLADLTSGSGDKGTPIILIQNYFTNYTN